MGFWEWSPEWSVSLFETSNRLTSISFVVGEALAFAPILGETPVENVADGDTSVSRQEPHGCRLDLYLWDDRDMNVFPWSTSRMAITRSVARRSLVT
jgi:hypothetical protein